MHSLRRSASFLVRPFVFFSLFVIVMTVVEQGYADNADPGSGEATPSADQFLLTESSSSEDLSRIDEFTLFTPLLRVRDRTIQVYLPPDYFTSEKSYPVLYLQDGEFMFEHEEEDAHADEILDKLFNEGVIDGVIAVAIFGSINRWDEYSPWINNRMNLYGGWKSEVIEGGEGDAYLDFVIHTLKPEIDSRYRTLADRENTLIAGHSMGGLISLYAGLSHPEIFSKVIAFSPAIWFAETDGIWQSNNQLINYINHVSAPKNVDFYIYVGTAEWEWRGCYVTDAAGKRLSHDFIWLDGAVRTAYALDSNNIPAENIKLEIGIGGEHAVHTWRNKFASALTWLLVGETGIEVIPLQIEITSTPMQLPTATATVVVTATALSPETKTSESEEGGDVLAVEENAGIITTTDEKEVSDGKSQNLILMLIGFVLVVGGLAFITRLIFTYAKHKRS